VLGKAVAFAASGVCLSMPTPLRAATIVWDGGAGTGAWGTGTNWSTNFVPANTDSLVFSASSANNQYAITLGANRTTAGITFNNAAGTNAFTFSGNTLTINAGGIANNDTETQVFNSAVRVSSAQTWSAASGGLAFNNVTLANGLTLSGASNISVAGTLTNSGGNRTITNNSTGAATFTNINLSNNGTSRTLTFSGSGSTGVSGVIANGSTSTAGVLTKSGAGTLTLSGNNTYTGGTNINAGTLQLGNSERIANNTAVTIASGATFDLNNFTETIGALSGTGTVQLGSGMLTVGSGNASSTFSGAFAGGDTGTFAKTGTGTLTFGSGMDLSSGTLVLDGGTLNLGGFTSTFGALSVTATSILDFGTSGSSILNLLNSVTIDSLATLKIQNWTDTVDYFYSLLSPGANLGRIVFSGFAGADTKWQSYGGQITPVPETSIYGAALLGLSALFAAWRLHRRTS
jgi:autotransporter-associated beta strand protein